MLPYVKQTWTGYDSNLSADENVSKHAVVVPEYMNHIEEGLEEVSKASIQEVKITVAEDTDTPASGSVADGVIDIVIPKPVGEKGADGQDGQDGANGQDGQKGEPGVDGTDGHSMGASSEEPVDGSISVSSVDSASNNGDHFVSPSGKVYKIVGSDDTNYTVSETNIVLAGVSVPGEKGENGQDGSDGADGKSAYDVAVENGFTGTEAEWLVSLKGADGHDGENGKDGSDGADGKSAYDVAVANGFTGTELDWLASLKGEKGTDGQDGENGKDGSDGVAGADGKSAYEIAVENGFEGDEAAWLESLKGEPGVGSGESVPGVDGKSAYDVAVENGFNGDETAWLESLKGADGLVGADGKSAYDVAVENGYEGSADEWLVSLKGADGVSGEDGKSAYDIAVANGYEGTEAEWLTSLKGADGIGETGADGVNGLDGHNMGVSNVEPVENIISKDDVVSATEIGDHFVAPSGKVYSIEDLDDTNYAVTETLVDLKGPSGDAAEGDGTSFSIGVSTVEPVDGSIAITEVASASKVGDHFIAPSGSLYKIIDVKEESYMTEKTNVNISENFKGNAIGHCSGLEVSVLDDGQKSPKLNVKYTDPTNEGVPYGGTVVCIKEGSVPENPEDGDIIKNIMEKDKYKTDALSLEIPRTETLQRDFNVTLFPYSASGVFNMLKRESKGVQINWAASKKFIRFNELKNIVISNELGEMGLHNEEYLYFNNYSLHKYISDDNVKNEEIVPSANYPKQITYEGTTYEITKFIQKIIFNNKIYFIVSIYDNTKTATALLEYNLTDNSYTMLYIDNSTSITPNDTIQQFSVTINKDKCIATFKISEPHSYESEIYAIYISNEIITSNHLIVYARANQFKAIMIDDNMYIVGFSDSDLKIHYHSLYLNSSNNLEVGDDTISSISGGKSAYFCQFKNYAFKIACSSNNLIIKRLKDINTLDSTNPGYTDKTIGGIRDSYNILSSFVVGDKLVLSIKTADYKYKYIVLNAEEYEEDYTETGDAEA